MHGIRFADFTLVKEKWRPLPWKTKYRIISVDVKTKREAFEYFLNQANDFLTFSDEVYLICTPGLVLLAGMKWTKPVYTEQVFIDKLSRNGIGLCVYDQTTRNMNIIEKAQKSKMLFEEQKKKALAALDYI